MTTGPHLHAPSHLLEGPRTYRMHHGLHEPTAVLRREFRGASLQARLLARSMRMTLRPLLGLWGRAPGLPWPTGLLDLAGTLLPPIEGTRCRPVVLTNCGGSWVEAPGAGDERVVLYMHGGAFLCGGLKSHQRLVSRISAEAEAAVLAVDYRMLPAHSIGDAVDDGVDAYEWLLSRGYRPDQIVVAGDSAGGYLAFMIPLALRDRGLPAPGAIVALSPLTELDPSRKLGHSNAERCALLPGNAFEGLAGLSYRRDARVRAGSDRPGRVCPVDADLSGMPPVLIQVGSHELLLVDAELIADRLAWSGTRCELQVWDRQVHVFQAAADLLPESLQAIGEIGEFIRATVPSRMAAAGGGVSAAGGSSFTWPMRESRSAR
ncbi:alpha/beta hydrolase [Rhodococcus sp. HM1]|nr:alpha/beta hydrolase fold domain-containing protein [Rhodococcus sp. HM1]MCK8672494.1 alpha/beta hydrolase [Rhodococcus sp. HM1]